MVDLKPNLDSYARVSYFRELHGDVPGAIEAMRLRGLRRRRRAREPRLRADAARQPRAGARPRRASRRTHTAWLSPAIRNTCPRRPGLRASPRHAGTSPPRSAATSASSCACRCRSTRWRSPTPSSPPAGGRPRARTSRSCEVQQRLLRRSGVNVDAEMARVRGRSRQRRARGAARPRGMGRRAQRARGRRARLVADPGRASRPRAFRMRSGPCGSAPGTRCTCTTPASPPAAPGGPRSRARYLTRALDANPRFSPLHAPRARRALEALR